MTPLRGPLHFGQREAEVTLANELIETWRTDNRRRLFRWLEERERVVNGGARIWSVGLPQIFDVRDRRPKFGVDLHTCRFKAAGPTTTARIFGGNLQTGMLYRLPTFGSCTLLIRSRQLPLLAKVIVFIHNESK